MSDAKPYPVTIYKLSWGSNGPEQVRYFHCVNASDVCVRFSERVVELDRDPAVGGAWVCLARLPDSIYPDGMHLMAWTKTSDESPTRNGVATPDEALTWQHA